MKHTYVGVILFIIILFFICRQFFSIGTSAVGTISSYLLYPVLRVQHSCVEPMNQWFKNRATITELTTILATIMQERDDLFAENVALKGAKQYVNGIKELSHFNTRYSGENGIIAHILAKHFSNNSHFFFVDAGVKQGIKKDMVAIYNNCLVGRVVEVYPWYCKVCLITDADCKVAALCSKTGASGIHEGKNNQQHTTLCYVSHLDTVEVRDTILSSGEGLIFPAGFALGIIEAVQRGDLFYAIQVKPALDFDALRYCLLVAKSDVTVRVRS
jgi:rod shape-determining protein MreC